MKADVIPPVDLDELHSALTKNSLIRPGTEIELKSYPPAFPRDPQSRRWHYKVSSNGQTVCHLTIGRDLDAVHVRLKEFAQVCPELACQPLLFWQKADGLGVLCLEHFSGTSLDSLVLKGECTADRWLALNRQAQELLKKTRKPSTKSQLENELARLMERIAAFPGISPIDLGLLRELAVPAILQGMEAVPLTTRWSNGDYCGRNLLVDTVGNLRLIDYDFLAPTHFGDADWLRLINFSVLPPQLDQSALPEVKAASKPQQEIWFWLIHLVQLSKAEFSEVVRQHIAQTVCRLFAAITRATEARSRESERSMFVTLLSTQQNRTQKLLEERTTWAQSLDEELRRALAIIPQQRQLAEERLDWIRSVEVEQKVLKANFDRLTEEYASRTNWAQKLEKELQQTQSEHAAQSKLAQERSIWALSIEKELSAAREALAKLSQEFNERSTWAKSLDAELHSTRIELTGLKTACAFLAEQLPGNTITGDIAILKQCQITLFESQKQIADAETNKGKLLDARLQAEVAETEVNRLKTELALAQVHVDHLLGQIKNLRENTNVLGAAKQAAEATVTQLEQQLNTSIIEGNVTLEALARYERNWICRLANRYSTPAIVPKSKP